MEQILFVDDDQNILNAYCRALRKEFRIETALGGEEGLEMIAGHETYAVIVTDMRMPGMDGIQFLAQVKEQSPDTIRIMLTGNADQQTAIEAVNEGNIFRFLTKPCPAEVLGQVLAEGIQQYRAIKAEKQLLAKTIQGSAQMFTDLLDERKQAEAARHHLEQQLFQAQKMEAVGRLAGGVAHDFNNLLTAILGYSDFLMSGLKPDDPQWSFAEEIFKAGERAASLTRQLLAFSRKQILQPRVLDLNAIITEMEKLLRRVIGEDIRFITRLDPALGLVKADPGQIEQIVMNLVVNARDAMPQGGQIVIQSAQVKPTQTAAAPGFRSEPHVMLSVSDTGCGMDEELQAHIFEPFFTTKEVGRGTGLGLSTVYGIVTQSGGEIEVESAPEQGTAFKIYLPRVEGAVEDFKSPTRTSTSARGPATILLVEDEAPVRKLIQTLLHKQGHTVLEASCGAEALVLCEQHPGAIQLLITDVVMPHFSGHKLAALLAPCHPGLRVLFMSGYNDQVLDQHGALDPQTAFLPKPFLPDALLAKVCEALDQP